MYSFIIDNVFGTIEEIVMTEQNSLKKKADRALILITNDITPQESIREIFRRFPQTLTKNNVREKLYKKMHEYCISYKISQKMFDDICHHSPGAIPDLRELLIKTNFLLFFRNELLFNQFDHSLGKMYNDLTDEQKLEFAPLVLRSHGYLLGALLEKDRSEELCFIAVAQSGVALEFVPTKLWKDTDIMDLAVTESAYALHTIVKELTNKNSILYMYEEDKLDEILNQLTKLAYLEAGQQLKGRNWFEQLWKKIPIQEQKECIKNESRKREDACNRWNNENT